MYAELRGLSSPDLTELTTQAPADSEHFAMRVHASIGLAGEPGEQVFEFLVCSPSWLAQRAPHQARGFWFARHVLVLPRYDYRVLWHAIDDLCHHTDGNDWTEIATRLSRYGAWEFEDAQPAAAG